MAAIAPDLGRSQDNFAAGFERWKEVAPKARVYVDRVQDSMKKPREAGEGELTRKG